MPSPLLIAILHHAITLTSVAASALALLSWRAAWCERLACHELGVTNGRRAAMRVHLVTSSTRLLFSVASLVGGIMLMTMPPFVLPAGVLAGSVWLLSNVLMTTNLGIECWNRTEMER
jgi:hypothetical protein